MSNIIDLGERRKPAPAKPARRAPVWTGLVVRFCTACTCEEFKILAAGAVHCAGCGLLMNNLTVIGASE